MITLSLDGNGIAAAIGSGAAAIVLVGNFVMTVINWRRSSKRDVQIKEVKDLVNDKSDQLTAFVAKEAFEAGRKHERDAPHEPSPPVAIVTPDVLSVAPQCVPVIIPDKT